MSKPLFPEHFYIYISDYDSGQPIYTVATDLRDCDEGDVAIYQLKERGKKVLSHSFKCLNSKF